MGKTNENNDQSWRERINFNFIVALFLILFSCVAFWLIPYQIEKPKLFFGRALMGLTPTLFPRLIILGLLGLSILYLIESFRLREENLFKDVERRGYLRVLVTLIVAMAYALLLEPLGFVISSILAVGILTFYYGNRNVFILFFVIIGIPLAIYFVFTRLLLVSLPEGPFF